MPLDLDWDHNAWYQARLLRALPIHLDEVLEVGCGAGSFAARLATRASHVDAIDRAPHMVALARERVPSNIDVHVADVATLYLPPAHYDAVTSISVWHHVDLTQVLPRLAETLRPGGVLIAVALPKTDLPRDLPVEALSAVGHRVWGAAFRVEQTVYDRTTDTLLSPPLTTVSTEAVLIFDGVFLMRPELIDQWELRILVSTAFEKTVERAVTRERQVLSPAEVERRWRERYIPSQQFYFATVQPTEQADIIVYNDEPLQPRWEIRGR